MDIKTAFLNGHARRRIYIEIPQEDPRSTNRGMVALLKRALYGTQDASMIWQDELRNVMVTLFFCESLRIPCSFFHKHHDLHIAVHVDDLFCVGDVSN